MQKYFKRAKLTKEQQDDPFPKPWEIVLQKPSKPGYYCSALLKERYQIIQSYFYEGQSYYIFDHKKQDIIRTKNGDFFELFSSLPKAEQYLGVTNSESISDSKISGKTNSDSKSNSKPAIRKEKSTMETQKTGRGRRDRGPTALSFLRDTIRSQGQLSDKEIAAIVKQQYPDSTYTNHYVKYIRKKIGAPAQQAA